MVDSPATSRPRRGPARDLPVLAGGHTRAIPERIAHAALAIDRGGGTPLRHHLDTVLRHRVDRVELDLCATADGQIVLRHDTCLRDGRPLTAVTLPTLRRLEGVTLTLDEAAEHFSGRMRMLLDIKTARAAQLVGIWLRRRRDIGLFTACSRDVSLLLHLRFAAPRVARWPTLPDLGGHSRQHLPRVIGSLIRNHGDAGKLRRGAGEVQAALRELPGNPKQSLCRVVQLPWREHLGDDVSHVTTEVRAEGICLQRWLLTPEVVHGALQRGLHVNTWTVNDVEWAALAIDCDVSSITSDRPELITVAARQTAAVVAVNQGGGT